MSNIESVEEAVAPKLVLLEESRRMAESLAAMYAHEPTMKKYYEGEAEKCEAQIKGLMYNERWVYTPYYMLIAVWLHGNGDKDNDGLLHDGSFMYPVFDICCFNVRQYRTAHDVEPWDSEWYGR